MAPTVLLVLGALGLAASLAAVTARRLAAEVGRLSARLDATAAVASAATELAGAARRLADEGGPAPRIPVVGQFDSGGT